MQVKKINSTFILRFDKGEEIIQTLADFCTKEELRLGSVSAIGATNNLELACFETATKNFFTKKLSGDFEILSLVGNITTIKNEIYIHLHITVSDKNFNCFGGHLKQAYISATCEMMIQTEEGQVDREFSENIGLNLLKFD